MHTAHEPWHSCAYCGVEAPVPSSVWLAPAAGLEGWFAAAALLARFLWGEVLPSETFCSQQAMIELIFTWEGIS